MKCKRCRSRIYDLLDDALSAAEADRVREHLDGCAECRRFRREELELAALIKEADSLRRLHYRGIVPSVAAEAAPDRAPAPAPAAPAIPAGADRRTGFRKAWLFRHPWGAAAGASFFVLGLGAYFLLRPPGEGTSGSTAAPSEARFGTIPRVQVISVELQGKPAKPFIYQTPKASFIWIVPSKDIGG